MGICSEVRVHAPTLFARGIRAMRQCVLLALLGLVSALVFGLQSAGALENRSLTISEQLAFTEEVKEAYLLVSSRNRIIHSAPASWIESTEGDSITCIGRVPVSQEDAELEVLFVAIGITGNIRSSFRIVNLAEAPPTAFLSSLELRERLIERRGALRQLQTEVRMQDERLQGLQEDADAIANVARIVTAEDELADVRKKIAQIDEAHKSIEHRALQMKARPQPLNAQTREAQLTQQLAELSSELSATEITALKRISIASGELKDKLRLIEETREEKISLLEEELAEARRGR
jgi:hypothetical protein